MPTTRRVCAWCLVHPIPPGSRPDRKWCGKRCRQAAWRFNVQQTTEARGNTPMHFTYADPPYPGRAHLYPENQEVDHAALIASMVDSSPDGWALSTASDTLQSVLALCPPDVRVLSWVRAVRHVKSAAGLSSWEPVIMWGGRPLPTGEVQRVVDSLVYRGRYHSYPGALIGMKPPEFYVWLFENLGVRPGDTLDEIFPGSGAGLRTFNLYTGGLPRPGGSHESLPLFPTLPR